MSEEILTERPPRQPQKRKRSITSSPLTERKTELIPRGSRETALKTTDDLLEHNISERKEKRDERRMKKKEKNLKDSQQDSEERIAGKLEKKKSNSVVIETKCDDLHETEKKDNKGEKKEKKAKLEKKKSNTQAIEIKDDKNGKEREDKVDIKNGNGAKDEKKDTEKDGKKKEKKKNEKKNEVIKDKNSDHQIEEKKDSKDNIIDTDKKEQNIKKEKDERNLEKKNSTTEESKESTKKEKKEKLEKKNSSLEVPEAKTEKKEDSTEQKDKKQKKKNISENELKDNKNDQIEKNKSEKKEKKIEKKNSTCEAIELKDSKSDDTKKNKTDESEGVEVIVEIRDKDNKKKSTGERRKSRREHKKEVTPADDSTKKDEKTLNESEEGKEKKEMLDKKGSSSNVTFNIKDIKKNEDEEGNEKKGKKEKKDQLEKKNSNTLVHETKEKDEKNENLLKSSLEVDEGKEKKGKKDQKEGKEKKETLDKKGSSSDVTFNIKDLKKNENLLKSSNEAEEKEKKGKKDQKEKLIKKGSASDVTFNIKDSNEDDSKEIKKSKLKENSTNNEEFKSRKKRSSSIDYEKQDIVTKVPLSARNKKIKVEKSKILVTKDWVNKLGEIRVKQGEILEIVDKKKSSFLVSRSGLSFSIPRTHAQYYQSSSAENSSNPKFDFAKFKEERKKTTLKRMFQTKQVTPTARSVTKSVPNVFGMSIKDLKNYASFEEEKIPKIVTDCVTYLQDKKAYNLEGIFRQSGGHGLLEELKAKYSDPKVQQNLADLCNDPHVVAVMLKQFFGLMSEPVIPFTLYNEFINGFKTNQGKGDAQLATFMIEIVNKLPDINREILFYLISYLTTVAKHSDFNLMSSLNLGLVFGPNLFRPVVSDHFSLMDNTSAYIVEYLIDNYHILKD